ncbi:MAG: caspase family protein [Candidatus Aminicenantes bacterium]|nr:caspase family protein [Candidatus Aminicenantes bacterium]
MCHRREKELSKKRKKRSPRQDTGRLDSRPVSGYLLRRRRFPMKRRNPGVIAGVLLLILLSGAKFSASGRQGNPGRRYAIVVGNNAYPDSPLRACLNDARAIGRALQDVGFTVTFLEDATRQKIYDGDSVESLRLHAISANEIQRLSQRARVKILVLDACRTNPYARSRAGGDGLALMEARGTLIAFATGANQVARDGSSEGHGIFTAARSFSSSPAWPRPSNTSRTIPTGKTGSTPSPPSPPGTTGSSSSYRSSPTRPNPTSMRRIFPRTRSKRNGTRAIGSPSWASSPTTGSSS